jgi:hypothetical protein
MGIELGFRNGGHESLIEVILVHEDFVAVRDGAFRG